MANGPLPGWPEVVYFLADFGLFYLTAYSSSPLNNCVAENKEKGNAEGEICEVKAALGGLMVGRPLRPFPLLGQGLGRGIWSD